MQIIDVEQKYPLINFCNSVCIVMPPRWPMCLQGFLNYHSRMIIDVCRNKWTVPQLSFMIIYNCSWSILIQTIFRIILLADNLI